MNSVLTAQLSEMRQADFWNDWRWQLRHRVRSKEELARYLTLADSEERAIDRMQGPLPLGITPYALTLIDPRDANDPIRKTLVPRIDEFTIGPGESTDPLGEESHRPVPGIVHRYPDRVLFLMTGFCPVYCRYCTRGRMVGSSDSFRGTRSRWDQSVEYIEKNERVRDVLITGGDPLTESDERLEYVLKRLYAIPHVEYLRIGSKVPVTLPMRITDALCAVVRRYHPVWLSLHINHPRELTHESREAITKLVDAGVPVGSQTVLLKGVNDSPGTLKKLFHELIKVRVKPYYLFHCDPIRGSGHFRTSVARGLEIIRALRGHTSGYAIPTYALDLAGSGGKIPLSPDYVEAREGKRWVFRNFRGELHTYYDGED